MSKELQQNGDRRLNFVEKHTVLVLALDFSDASLLGAIYREAGDLLFKTAGARASIGSYIKSVSYDPFGVLNV